MLHPLYSAHKRKLQTFKLHTNCTTKGKRFRRGAEREKEREREMLKEESIGIRANNWARVCDTCRSAPCTVYCRADSAYLCTGCDIRIHAANKLSSRHERVWVCEACERAPAAFICKADAASLCASCDADIHSANPLARRHQRVPVMPIPGSIYGPPGPKTVMGLGVEQEKSSVIDDDEEEAASWLLFNVPDKNNNHQNQNQTHDNNINHGFLFNEEGVDEYLDLVEYNSCQDDQFSADQQYTDQRFTNQDTQCYSVSQKSCGGDADRIVPVQCGEAKNHHIQQQSFQHQKFQLGMEYDTSNMGYGYPASLSHSVSMTSMDIGIVPESAISEVSMSHPRPPKGTIDLFSSTPVQMPTQLTPMDREARVMRYREKKKNRKFEKTIRYASRKAYAETRPRIKGRFAKRTNVEEVDQMFSTALMTDSGYGIVPSF